MKKKFIFVILFLMIFAPMPFVWFGYGEKGIYGYAMLRDVFFLGGWSMTLISFAFYKTVLRVFRGVGTAAVIWSYFHVAIDFCGHLPIDYSPINACKFPMWISLIGSSGMFLSFWYYYDQMWENEE